MSDAKPRVVIVGAGFGGLNAARALNGQPVDVLLVDRNNYHTFTPLLYQVATCGLDPSDIAYPVRGIFRRQKNLSVLLGSVTNIDTARRVITVSADGDTREELYDYLIVAAGSVTNFFGNDAVQKVAFEVKDLSGSVRLRNHILKLLERAAWTEDTALRRALTTMVVVGGGATGIETAGALVELYNFVVKREYPHIADLAAKVILLEATDKLLAPYPERLRKSAVKQLTSLGVAVQFGAKLTDATEDSITLEDGTIIPTYTLIWSAGVSASPLAKMLNVPLERGGRVPVNPDLTVKGLESVLVVGDMAHLIDPKTDAPHPQMIPVAIQQAQAAAKNILAMIDNKATEAFTYWDKGIMATIGRRRAVAYPFNAVQLTGWFAWFTWLGLHLIWLLGFRNRLQVMLNWAWQYFTFDRSVRILLEHTTAPRKIDLNPENNGAS
jgi:NADH dehydrogenase